MDKTTEKDCLTLVNDPGFEPGKVDRRRMLQLMGASAALAAGLAGCDRKPPRNIVSRHSGPEYQKPGVPLYYSTTWTDGPYPYGMVVKCVDGRPVKIEGNPDHPLNGEASNARMQASLLSLYDPDRLRHPMKDGQRSTWDAVDMEIVAALKNAGSIAIIDHAGPRSTFANYLPNAAILPCEPVQQYIYNAANNKAYTQKIHFDKIDLILSLDCDFLGQDGPAIPQSRDYAQRKQIKNNPKIIKNYVIESGMSLTGSNADVRMKLRPSAFSDLIDLLQSASGNGNPDVKTFAEKHHLNAEHLQQLLNDISHNKGKVAVCGGYHLPYAVHSNIYRLNEALGALDQTVSYLETTQKPSLPQKILNDLAGGVDVLIVLGCNPVYTWGDAFKNIIQKARTSIGHDLYINETLELCQYQLPSHHNLENWNIVRTEYGYSYCQPTIQPLFDTRQEEASLFQWNQLVTGSKKPGDWSAFIKSNPPLMLSSVFPRENKDAVLKKGFYQNIFSPKSGKLPRHNSPVNPGDYELVIRPHHALYDGRFGNNAWLQEMPDPVSKLVWDNAAAISPATAEKLKISEGDVIEIAAGEKKIEIPALIQPGAADNVITVTLGHGRTKAGPAGTGVGVNVAPLLPHDGSRVVYDVKVRKTGKHHRLVRVQNHFSMEGRKIALDCTLAEYKKDPHIIEHIKGHPHYEAPHGTDIYPGYDYSTGYHWGMAIDTNLCTGCGACVIACQAENNIPVAGKEECARGRLMHWLRLDRYEEGDPGNPTIYIQPMTCQHCDNAPCENVCPVNATIHGPEGLNQMAYNRCVGTRYCANNCPYKVRRFNFFDYNKRFLRDPVQELNYNPQVTVRMRGVMEKCTFCIQRINAARFQAKNENRTLHDGEVKTACQQACPSGAIVFGNLNDPNSRAARLFKSNLAYHVLEQLNTQPSIAYLAKVRNIVIQTAIKDNNNH